MIRIFELILSDLARNVYKKMVMGDRNPVSTFGVAMIIMVNKKKPACRKSAIELLNESWCGLLYKAERVFRQEMF